MFIQLPEVLETIVYTLGAMWEFICPYIEYFGMGFGILGAAFIWRPTNKAKLVGFELWLYSNIFWIIFGITIHSLCLIAMNSVYLISNFLGIYYNVQIVEKEEEYIDELLMIPEKETIK